MEMGRRPAFDPLSGLGLLILYAATLMSSLRAALPPPRPLKAATRTIPIVMAVVGAIPSPPDWWIVLHVQAATLPVSALLLRNWGQSVSSC